MYVPMFLKLLLVGEQRFIYMYRGKPLDFAGVRFYRSYNIPDFLVLIERNDKNALR